jgi:tetratricopeptide (TPR) repeat protein
MFFLIVFLSFTFTINNLYSQNLKLENKLFKQTSELFFEGKYQEALAELDQLKVNEDKKTEINKENLGLIFYWRGVIFNKISDFPNAIKNLNSAKDIDFIPEDLNFELAQALFC